MRDTFALKKKEKNMYIQRTANKSLILNLTKKAYPNTAKTLKALFVFTKYQ